MQREGYGKTAIYKPRRPKKELGLVTSRTEPGGGQSPQFTPCKMETQIEKVTCSRPPRWTGPVSGPKPRGLGLTPGLPLACAFWLLPPALTASLKNAPPLPSRLSSP